MPAGGWVRFDRRWRRTVPIADPRVEIEAGFAGFYRRFHAENGLVNVAVGRIADPEVEVSTGQFNAQWNFEGDSQGWANVPEFVLVEQVDGRRHLLRIADG